MKERHETATALHASKAALDRLEKFSQRQEKGLQQWVQAFDETLKKTHQHVDDVTLKTQALAATKLDEVAEDGAGHPWHLDLVQGGQEKAGVVVHGGDDHLDAHRPQLARLHLPGQPLQDQLHEDGDHLVDVHSLALQNDHLLEEMLRYIRRTKVDFPPIFRNKPQEAWQRDTLDPLQGLPLTWSSPCCTCTS